MPLPLKTFAGFPSVDQVLGPWTSQIWPMQVAFISNSKVGSFRGLSGTRQYRKHFVFSSGFVLGVCGFSPL